MEFDPVTSTQTHLQWRESESSPPPRLDLSLARKKVPAGVLGILLGSLGIHKFVLGYTKQGVIMLLVSVLTLGFAAPLMGLIGLIEGIVYLTKSDEEFVRTYCAGRRPWF
jgi:TM2 domain-containing membrane protein YozV